MDGILGLALAFFGLILPGFFTGKWFREEAALGCLNNFVLFFSPPPAVDRFVLAAQYSVHVEPASAMILVATANATRNITVCRP